MSARIPALTKEQAEGILALCTQYHVSRLAAFGSAVKGTFHPDTSDYDFTVAFQRVESMRSADQYFGLKEAMEALLGRPVDLVMDQAVRNPYFREELDATAVEVYAT